MNYILSNLDILWDDEVYVYCLLDVLDGVYTEPKNKTN